MSTLFLIALFLGLAFGSVVMWRGVERYDRRGPLADSFGRELPSQRVGNGILITAAAFLCFGAVGYLLLLSQIRVGVATGIALASAPLGAWIAFHIVTRWIVPAARHSPEDPRYSLQGIPGTVVVGIDSSDNGQIAYEANGRSVQVRARSVDGVGIPAGVDVAIERLEDDIAYVEPWSRVEERL